MKLNIYGLKDAVEGEFIFFFQAKNDGMMERAVKGALLTKEQNHFTNNMKDKDLYMIGEIETLTGEIKPSTPVFVNNVNQIRLALINEIKLAKAEAGEEKPEATEVYDEDGK